MHQVWVRGMAARGGGDDGRYATSWRYGDSPRLCGGWLVFPQLAMRTWLALLVWQKTVAMGQPAACRGWCHLGRPAAPCQEYPRLDTAALQCVQHCGLVLLWGSKLIPCTFTLRKWIMKVRVFATRVRVATDFAEDDIIQLSFSVTSAK